MKLSDRLIQTKMTVVIFALALIFLPVWVYAADTIAPIYSDVGTQLGAAAGKEGAGLELQDTRVVIANGIRYLLSFVGVIFVALMVYAGILWMTAGGNDEQVGKAKKLIFQAMIGLFVVFSAYSITTIAYRIATGKTTADTCAGGNIDSPNCNAPPLNNSLPK